MGTAITNKAGVVGENEQGRRKGGQSEGGRGGER